MTDRQEQARRRRWADVVAIVAGVYVFLLSWSPPLLAPDAFRDQVGDAGGWWWALTVGGVLAIAAVFVAFRRRTPARILLALAGIFTLAGLLAFERVGWLAWATAIVPGLAMLLAAPFLGPMPSPEEEGEHR